MKLSDTHGWTPDTALERLALEGQDLSSYQAFWDRSAEVDVIRAIADQDSDESFTSSGVEDAEGIRPLLPRTAPFLRSAAESVESCNTWRRCATKCMALTSRRR
jgi:hypothetical protein